MEIGTEEASRLATLLEYDILDSESEESFDRLAEIAADLFDAPIALVSLVDGYRQWFKSRVGLSIHETPREGSFCEQTIRERDIMVVTDALRDRRFAGSPLVVRKPSIRFYAGAPLLNGDGHALGTICIMDRRARRTLSVREKRLLQALASMVMEQIEIRRLVREARASLQRIGRLSRATGMSDAQRWDAAQAETRAAQGALRAVQILSQRPPRKHGRLGAPASGVAATGRRGAVRGGTGAAARVRRSDRRRQG